MSEELRTVEVGPRAEPHETPIGKAAPRYGIVATIAFCLLVTGSNIPGPLLPVYRARLDLSAFTVTALFAAYLVGLVATFTCLARTRLTARAPAVLAAAVAVALAGDVALLAGDDAVGWLFVGRVLSGVSVGLGTGATATIVLATRGERGRAVAATGTLLGSFLGLVTSAAVADLLPAPTITVYWLHIAALTLAMLTLITLRRTTRMTVDRMISAPTGIVDTVPGADHIRENPRRTQFAGVALGAAGWALGGVVVGLLPTIVTDMIGSSSITVASLAPILLIGAACLAPRLIRRLPAPVTAATIVVGAATCFVGVWLDDLPTIVAACVVWGVGQGFAYATGLTVVTAGMNPVQQGRAASRYASTAYAFTGVVSVITGWIATSAGMSVGVGFACAVFSALCGIAVVLGHRRWPSTG